MDGAIDGDMEGLVGKTDETGRHHLPFQKVPDRFSWNHLKKKKENLLNLFVFSVFSI